MGYWRYIANLSTPTSKTTNNLLFDSNKVNFDKEVLEFKNTANSNYRPGIINKLIGHTVSRNNSGYLKIQVKNFL